MSNNGLINPLDHSSLMKAEDLNNVDDNIIKFYFHRVLSYPKNTADDFQYQLYKKKELYNFRIHHLPEFNNEENIKEYIKLKCLNKTIKLSDHQLLLKNYLTPDSPYSGLLLFHGLGLGKTCAAINIAENFKEQVEKYQTKIYIVVPGPTLKAEWKSQLVKCTGNEYKMSINKDNTIQDINETKINNYYKIMSVKSFLKHTIGEKVKDKNSLDKKKYIKNEKGEIERTNHINKINNLDNTLLIIDEAHGLTDNEYSNAVQYIVKRSKNLKILLLTGTPMKNSALDIVDLLNLIKPPKEKIKKSEIFDYSENISNLKFTKDGENKLINACKGYVSYMNNNEYYLFATKIDKGIITNNLKFTPIIPCLMTDFQKSLYATIKNDDEKLNKSSSDATNFAFPCLENNSIVPMSGYKGKQHLINNLYQNQKKYNEILSKWLNLKSVNEKLLIPDYENKKYFFGEILTSKYLNLFSSKYAECLKHIENLINDNAKPIFIYSNAVEIGINVFTRILKQNGYLEFKDDENTTMSKMNNDTVCYKCGKKLINHKDITDHEFKPAVFFSIIGKQNNSIDISEEEDKRIIDTYFNNPDNYDGKIIKIVLGSKVISEGYNIFNLREVHILDTYYNIARVEQVIGRAIRRCSHAQSQEQINKNPFPTVEVYRYCTITSDLKDPEREPTIDEILYTKAEKKHILIKRVERILKENAVDCPLFYNNNKYGKRYDKYADCIPLKIAEEYDSQDIKDKSKYCPVSCDYMKCEYKCNCDKLNEEYYDDNKKEYKKVKQSELNSLMLSNSFYDYEINKFKDIIKTMYIKKFVYTINDFIQEAQNHYPVFDIYFLYKALDSFIINSDNEIINLSYDNYIFDKFNRPGYLLYLNKFYIFQPLWEPIKQTINERETYQFKLNLQLSLSDFLKIKNLSYNDKNLEENETYDFESNKFYYENREEFDIVGIIDKEPNKKKEKRDLKDVFKLRKKMKSFKNNKKRLTGLQTYTGSVCFNSYTMKQIYKFCKLLNIPVDKTKNISRVNICEEIRDKLIEKEKYSTDNKTYLIIPINHPKFPFPFNIHDRSKHIEKLIKNKFQSDFDIIKEKKLNNNKIIGYDLIIKKNESNIDYEDLIKILKKHNYEYKIENDIMKIIIS